mmetsp:Transcript_77718/g.227884  ORF Transcript_77718/g.227884 Transcript_77718/m.227884 type:complete len:82 (+) Transcript_77718:559-804(+)
MATVPTGAAAAAGEPRVVTPMLHGARPRRHVTTPRRRHEETQKPHAVAAHVAAAGAAWGRPAEAAVAASGQAARRPAEADP